MLWIFLRLQFFIDTLDFSNCMLKWIQIINESEFKKLLEDMEFDPDLKIVFDECPIVP